MLRFLAIVAVAVAVARPSAAECSFSAGTVANRFIVTYNMVPDPMEWYGFYDMPRTCAEAKKAKFSQVESRESDKTTVWCRKKDFRVCVIFDEQGSVAGVQMAVQKNEIDKAQTPVDTATIPELRSHKFLGENVISATTYFVDESVLKSGGRPLDKDTLTAPDGIFIAQFKDNVEVGRMKVGVAESEAAAAGFTEQGCFLGMGKHYFQGLKKDGKCEAHRPYFLLYGPKSNKLHGYGYTMYGKTSQGRGWFETPPASVAKMIAPNSPDCMEPWIKKYGMFTMHVYFIARPWLVNCWW